MPSYEGEGVKQLFQERWHNQSEGQGAMPLNSVEGKLCQGKGVKIFLIRYASYARSWLRGYRGVVRNVAVTQGQRTQETNTPNRVIYSQINQQKCCNCRIFMTMRKKVYKRA